MARTITEIENEIIGVKNADPTLAGLSSSSRTAIWRVWVHIVAYAIWTLEKLFDVHLSNVRTALAEDKSHTLRWYRKMALLFQYGSALPDGSDRYNNAALTASQVENQQIIKHAAAVEDSSNLVTIKVAKESAGELVPLSIAEYNAFSSYINEIKDAGVLLQPISFAGDKLKVKLLIEIDPQVLSLTGERLDGTNATPIKSAINEYLRSLPFNGLFRVDAMIDMLQQVEGVVIPTAQLVQAAKNDVNNFSFINVKYQPYSGYLRIFDDADLEVTYQAS
jgi:hypothetical protein